MTRDDLELILRREGLTQPQTTVVLDAADRYATAQAKAAIYALGAFGPWPHVHYFAGASRTKVACGKPNVNLVNTTDRARVTCGPCKATTAWKATA